MIVGLHSTKLPQSWDIGSDDPSRPAISISVLQFLVDGHWQPAKPRTGMSIIWRVSCFYCTVVAICISFCQLQGRASFTLIASSFGNGDGNFSNFLGSFHPPIPVKCNWSVVARKMYSTSEFAKIVLSKCVIRAGFVTVA